MKVCRFFLFRWCSELFSSRCAGCDSSAPTDPSVNANHVDSNPAIQARLGDQLRTGRSRKPKPSNKLVLLDFTGSDWCGWCIMLDREVFSQPQFKEYASKNLVLVEVDFPQRKRVPAATREQNERLAHALPGSGLPNHYRPEQRRQNGGELGYMQGGPDAFIAVAGKTAQRVRPAAAASSRSRANLISWRSPIREFAGAHPPAPSE